MYSKHAKRMRILETYALTVQRRTLPGLVALVKSGQLKVQDLSVEELERIIAGHSGEDVDVRHLSDEELAAIINTN